MKKICQNVTKDEISRILNQYEANLLMSSESTSARMQKLGSDILNFNRYINGEEIIKKIKAYQENDITNQANKIFNSSISGLQRLFAPNLPRVILSPSPLILVFGPTSCGGVWGKSNSIVS